MAVKHELKVRLNDAQFRLLAKLSVKLGLDRNNVIRLALARLAEAEGLIKPPAQH